MKKLNKKNRKGFTLVELVVVILIIAILASATFLGGATVIKQSRVTKAQNDLRLYSQYAQDMLYENPSYAGKGGTLANANNAFKDEKTAAEAMNDKYLTGDMAISAVADQPNAGMVVGESVLKDSWENGYHIKFMKDATKTGAAIVFYSYGADATDQLSGSGIAMSGGKITVTEANTGDDLYVVVSVNDAGEVTVENHFEK